jgi:hypothetical protein
VTGSRLASGELDEVVDACDRSRIRVVRDERDDWSEHQPSANEENRFVEEHGWTEYGKWHLGADSEHDNETKEHWKSPTATSRTSTVAASSPPNRGPGSTATDDIKSAAAHVHGMIEAAS